MNKYVYVYFGWGMRIWRYGYVWDGWNGWDDVDVLFGLEEMMDIS